VRTIWMSLRSPWPTCLNARTITFPTTMMIYFPICHYTSFPSNRECMLTWVVGRYMHLEQGSLNIDGLFYPYKSACVPLCLSALSPHFPKPKRCIRIGVYARPSKAAVFLLPPHLWCILLTFTRPRGPSRCNFDPRAPGRCTNRVE